MTNKKIIVILGPTGSGKTSMAIDLAKQFQGEIINADSRSVYAGLDIGTAKPMSGVRKQALGVRDKSKPIKIQNINHFLFDIADPKKDVYTVADFQKDAKKVIEQILKKGKVPFIVGGTGFYIEALTKGYNLPRIDKDKINEIRGKLEEKSLKELLSKLKKIDHAIFKKIDKKNKRKIVRALEVFYLTGEKFSKVQKKFPLPYQFLKIGIKIDREKLYKRIDTRTKNQFEEGLIDEVRKLLKLGVPYSRFREFGFEYWPVAEYLKGDLKISKKELIEKIQFSVHGLVRRQETWFRRDKKIIWIKDKDEAKELIKEFLTQ